MQKPNLPQLIHKGGDQGVTGQISGLERLRHKNYNKGLAFSIRERQLLGIHGLLAPAVRTLDEQVQHCLLQFERCSNDLEKYSFLSSLSERNEHLFYKLLTQHIQDIMPYVYTPTVGAACVNYGLLYQNPKGLYVAISDRGHIYEVLRNWPGLDVRAICVTDGERILGLGDLGANGMGIVVGKMALYTAIGGVKPHQCLPICLDVGCNVAKVREDPLYLGLRQPRCAEDLYDKFLDEFMEAVVRRFGQNCLLHFEDFGNHNAFRLLAKYRHKYCMFNDDIQGTAAVGLAGILSALRITKTQLTQHTILFQGAGEAALGIALLCVKHLKKQGLSEEEAKGRIWLVDSKGVVVFKRPRGGLSEIKLKFAHHHEPIETLEEAVAVVKPTILIGASAVAGAFTKQILKKMTEFSERPIVFALSNPTSKSECTAEEAFMYTKGSCLFASGSPYPPVVFKGVTYHTSQVNNAYVFPGIALAVTACGIRRLPDGIYLLASDVLANLCTDEDLKQGRLFPSVSNIASCCLEIAVYICIFAYVNNLATVWPKPSDIRGYLKQQMYNVEEYELSLPKLYVDDHTDGKRGKQNGRRKSQNGRKVATDRNLL